MASFLQPSNLSLASFNDYQSWKRQRETYIKDKTDLLLNFSEMEIGQFYFSLEKSIKQSLEEFISNTSKDAEESDQNKQNTATDEEILQILLDCSVLYYFQRSLDVCNQYFSIFSSLIINYEVTNRFVISAIIKTFYWLAVDSNEPSQAFKTLFDFSKKTVQSLTNYYKSSNSNTTNPTPNINSNLHLSATSSFNEMPSLLSNPEFRHQTIFLTLIIFKTIRKFSLFIELTQILLKNLEFFIKISGSKDEDCQKIAIKLIEFLFGHGSNEDLNHLFTQTKIKAQQYLNAYLLPDSDISLPHKPHKIYCSLRFFTFVMQSSTQELFEFDLNVIIRNLIKFEYLDSNHDILNALFSFVIKVINTFGYQKLNLDLKLFLDLFYNRFSQVKEPIIYFEELLKSVAYSPTSNNDCFPYEDFLNFIYQLEASRQTQSTKYLHKIFLKCNMKKGKVCPFYFLYVLLKHFKQSTEHIDLDQFVNTNIICKHYIKCMFLHKPLLTTRIKELFAYPLDSSKHDQKFMTSALRIYPLYPDLFESNLSVLKQKLTTFFNSTIDYKFRKQIIKLSKIFDDSDEFLVFAATSDNYDKNRMRALSYLKPTPKLGLNTYLFQTVNDPSITVSIAGLKLVSQLYQYNPLSFKPLFVEFIHNILLGLMTTTNPQNSANYAQIISVFTKHVNVLIEEELSKTIISVSLKIVNSFYVKNNNDDTSQIRRNSTTNFYSQIEQQNESNDNLFASNSPKLTQASSLNFNNLSLKPNFKPTLMSEKPILLSENVLLQSSFNLNLLSNQQKPVNSTSTPLKFNLDILKIPELLMDEKKSLKEPNRSKLFLIFHSNLIDQRDSFLLKSISNLGSSCEPYLNDILHTYEHLFQTRTNETLLIKAVKSLTKLSMRTYNGLNIRLRCPQMITPLIQIISTTNSEKLRISIFQLFGNAFDSVDILRTPNSTPQSDMSAVMAHDPSYATELAISNIFKYMNEPSLTTLKTLSMIVEGDPTYSAQFLPKILPIFRHMIRRGSEMIRNKAFQFLEIILANTVKDFVPLLNIFMNEMRAFLYLESCVHFCSMASFYLKTDFISCANELFYLTLNQMTKCIHNINDKTSNMSLSTSRSNSHVLSNSALSLTSNLHFPLIAQKKSNKVNTVINDISLFKSLLQLATSMIIYQHQIFGPFIQTLECYMKKNQLTSKLLPTVFHLLTAIMQSIDIRPYTGRLFMFANSLFYSQKANICEFLAALCVYGELSIEAVSTFFESNSITYNKMDQLKEFNLNNKVKFIKDHTIKFPFPKNFIRLQTEHFFIDMEYPNELHISLWLKELTRITITKSPNPSIRACTEYLNLNTKFVNQLFPIAFLSCWKKANEADRDYFSNMVDHVLHNHKTVHPIFFELIQITYKALIPMKVDVFKVAELSPSHINSLFLILNAFLSSVQANCDYGSAHSRLPILISNESEKKNRDVVYRHSPTEHSKLNAQSFFELNQKKIRSDSDLLTSLNTSSSLEQIEEPIDIDYYPDQFKKLVTMCLNICIKMGRQAAARGLLEKRQKMINIMDYANWCGELGEWSKALEIYSSINAPLPYIIKSLSNLNRYDDLKKYEKEFQKMDHDDKMKVIDDYFWPYYHNHETEKLNEICKVFEKNWTLRRVLSMIYLSIYQNNYNRAQELIDKAYKMIIAHQKLFMAGDQNQIESVQDTSEILVECQEVLNYKTNKSSALQTKSFFSRRVKHFKRSKDIWERTIDLRQLVVPIESNIHFYLKIISELRKAKYFSLIDYYFDRHMVHCNDQNVFLQTIKIAWDRGERFSALHTLDLFASIFHDNSIANAMNVLLEFKKITNLTIRRFTFYMLTFSKTFASRLKTFCYDQVGISDYSQDFNVVFRNTFDSLSNSQQINIMNSLYEKFTQQTAKCLIDAIKDYQLDSHYVASTYFRAADYHTTIDPIKSLPIVSDYVKNALDIEPNKLKLWRKWAYVNSYLFSESKQGNILVQIPRSRKNRHRSSSLTDCETNSKSKNINPVLTQDAYANNAIASFLKLTEFVPDESLEFASQILALLSASSEKVTIQFINLTLPPSTVIQVLPLITSKLDNPDKNVNLILTRLLTNSGIIYFQEIYFALNLYIASKDNKSLTAQSIVDKIKQANPVQAEDSSLFIDGMNRCALTWFEIWIRAIEDAAKYPKEILAILQELFEMYDHPQCDLDDLFIKIYQGDVMKLRKSLQKATKSEEIWTHLRTIYNSLRQRVNRLSAIFLSKVSEKLCMKRDFSIIAPGVNLSTKTKNDSEELSDYEITSIDPVLEVLETQQHPRFLLINTRSGKKLKYLLKGSEDLRLDERFMLLFALINGLLSHTDSTKESHVYISRYAVIPLTKSVGLIQ